MSRSLSLSLSLSFLLPFLKAGLLYILLREFSNVAASTLLNRVAKLSARWIGDRGFSIGIDDVTPTAKVNQVKASLLSKGYSTCDDKIALFKRGKLPPMSGCNEEQTLESLLLGELSQIREDAGAVCLKELDQNHCAPLIMAVCGSKGSKINISQMVACGQFFVLEGMQCKQSQPASAVSALILCAKSCFDAHCFSLFSSAFFSLCAQWASRPCPVAVSQTVS